MKDFDLSRNLIDSDRQKRVDEQLDCRLFGVDVRVAVSFTIAVTAVHIQKCDLRCPKSAACLQKYATPYSHLSMQIVYQNWSSFTINFQTIIIATCWEK